MNNFTKNKYFKKYVKILIFVVIMILIILFMRSCMLQSIIKNQYSSFNASKSLVYPEVISIDTNTTYQTHEPVNNWHNQLFCFYDSGLSPYLKEDFNLTILFDFYSPKNNTFHNINGFYEPTNPYYSSFYGLYIIEDYSDHYFVDENNKLIIDHIAKVPQYDYQNLILTGLGCPDDKNFFEIQSLIKYSEYETIAGVDGFTQYHCIFSAPGVQHHYNQFKLNYIQFGFPKENASTDFSAQRFYSRFYIKTLPEDHLILCFYIMSPDEMLVENTENDVLKNLILNIKPSN